MSSAPGGFTCRPEYRGRRGIVTAGHYLAAMAGFQTLTRGGNAVDAAVAAGLVESLVEPNQNGLGGENPMLAWPPGRSEPVVLCGQGAAPAAATLDAMRALGLALIPGDGYLPACVPAAVSTYLTALMEFGTMSLADVAAPGLELARNGFVVTSALSDALAGMASRFRSQWPSSAAVYMRPDGEPYRVGDTLANPDWAATVEALVNAEREANEGRLRGLERAHECFYRGEVADRIASALDGAESLDASGAAHRPLLTAEDLARHETRLERPIAFDYHGSTVWKCGPWSQGPVFLQQLALLSCFDLAAMEWGSADRIHTIVECAKLAFADREAWYGDPLFSDVPLERLLSLEYNAAQRERIAPDRAITEPLWDDIQGDARRSAGPKPLGGDTTHVDAADADGLMVSLTPSGGWLTSSPVLKGLGFPLGTRAQMFVLKDGHPNALAPGKRPRTTLTPSMARLPGGRRFAFGTPGGDGQDQWTLQFLLNHVDFRMGLQEAVEAPTFHTRHHPSSFYPREAFAGSLAIEDGFAPEVLEELRGRGHKVETVGRWQNGRVLGIAHEAGTLTAAVSPRHETAYAAGW